MNKMVMTEHCKSSWRLSLNWTTEQIAAALDMSRNVGGGRRSVAVMVWEQSLTYEHRMGAKGTEEGALQRPKTNSSLVCSSCERGIISDMRLVKWYMSLS